MNCKILEVSWAYRNTPSFLWWYRFLQKPQTHWTAFSKWVSDFCHDSTRFQTWTTYVGEELAYSCRGLSPCPIDSMFQGLGGDRLHHDRRSEAVHIMTEGKQRERKFQGTKYNLQKYALSDILPTTWLQHIKFPEPLNIALPAGG